MMTSLMCVWSVSNEVTWTEKSSPIIIGNISLRDVWYVKACLFCLLVYAVSMCVFWTICTSMYLGLGSRIVMSETCYVLFTWLDSKAVAPPVIERVG